MKSFLLRIGFSKLHSVSAKKPITLFRGTFVNKIFTFIMKKKTERMIKC